MHHFQLVTLHNSKNARYARCSVTSEIHRVRRTMTHIVLVHNRRNECSHNFLLRIYLPCRAADSTLLFPLCSFIITIYDVLHTTQKIE